VADELDKSITTPVDIESEMKKSYLDYAMSVIVARALPDVRDGLKPVHRRILFGMYELGLTSTKAYRKCAKIVGEVLGNSIRTATLRCTTRSCASRRISTCATRSSTARETSAPWTAIPRGHAVHRSAPGENRRRNARRHRKGNRRFRSQLR
jgi:hypothetical protein